MRICERTKKEIIHPWNEGNPCYCTECRKFMDKHYPISEVTEEDINWALFSIGRLKEESK